MTNWTAIGILIAASIAVFFGATIKTFTAKARINRERDNDIRASIAGYESGELIPALAAVIEEVNKTKLETETIPEALTRYNVDRLFKRAVDASIRSQSPRARETSLVYRSNGLGACLLGAHAAGPAALYSALTSGYNLPRTAVTVAIVIFSSCIAGATGFAVLVARGEIALADAIREGKDAA